MFGGRKSVRSCVAFLGSIAAALITLTFVAASPASASQTDCLSYGYACTPGYTGANAAGTWAWTHYGASYAQTANGYHNCTLYAAWRLQQNGMADPGNWGNAVTWASHNGGGNHTPAVGSIAWWGSEVAAGFGHVAYVDQVSGSQVHVVADNFTSATTNGYTDAGWIAASSVDAFLHPHDVGGGSGALADGTFVVVTGLPAVYRIAGGAPLYVSSWAAVGGNQPVSQISQAQFDALRAVPADGTILDASGGGVFIVAGGAPLYLSNWAAIGGPKPGVAVDEWDVDNTANPAAHLRPVPLDGTILDASGGGVFIVAGGAPLYLSNWAAIGGPKPGVAVDEWDVDNTANPAAHLRPVPLDGTILDASGGGVFIVAGGAPLYLSNWAAIGGPKPGVAVDEWDVDNTANPAAHLRPVPLDGTILDASGGGVFIVAGGAPLYLSNWAAIGGPKPGVAVDEWDVDNTANPAAHLRSLPASGTFLRTISGAYYRVAGGTAFPVTDWTPFGGPQSSVLVDQWDVDNASTPAAHLLRTPMNGTQLIGTPSQSGWLVNSGRRYAHAATAGAVTLNDASLKTVRRADWPFGDFNADGKTDYAVFRPSNRTWYAKGLANVAFGTSGDIPLAADFNGDGKTDYAVFRPSNGTWYVKGLANVAFGRSGDIPLAADFNGDGKTDYAVFRPSNGTWYVKGLANVAFGRSGDIPLAADFNGDGKTDYAVFRPSNGTWYVKGLANVAFGRSGDIPLAADFNGDGKTDYAVFRPSNGTWYVKGLANVAFGRSGDIPLAADFNGDGKTDYAVFRPSNGTWYVKGLANVAFGRSGDKPV